VTRKLLALLAMISALVVWTVGHTSTAEGAEFACGDRVLTDFGKPLEGLPGDRLPGGSLPFAPNGVELRAGRSIIVDGEPILYALVLNRFAPADGSGLRPVALDWVLSFGLEPVDRLGRPTAVAARRSWRIGELGSSERRFGLRADPGLYRVSIGIRGRGGPVLGGYRQFVRVLPVRRDLGIAIRGGRSFRPGDTVTARIENRGTGEVLLPTGSGLELERLEGGRWIPTLSEEAPSVLFEDPEFLAGGRASRCTVATIPSDSTPGMFRYSVEAHAGAGGIRTLLGRFFVL
jgi:hypothetical protein